MGCIKKAVSFAENPFHLIPAPIENIIQSIAPIALTALGQPELGAGLSGLNAYANSAPGKGLVSGLLAGGTSYLGNQLGAEVNGGDSIFNGIGGQVGDALGSIGDATGLSDVYDALKSGANSVTGGLLGGSNNAGTLLSPSAASNPTSTAGIFGGGTGGAASAYSPSATDLNVSDLGKNSIDSLNNFSSPGSLVDSAGSGLTNAASTASNNVGDFLSNPSTANSIGTSVANSGTGTLAGSLSKYAVPLLSAGVGAFTNNSAKNDLLASTKANSALFAPYLNAKFTPGDLTQDPGYQFQLDQGTQALNRKAAAGGDYFSGNALKEAQQFGQGLAGTTYNDAYQRFLAQNQQNLGAATSMAGINNDIGNTKANSVTNLGNLITGAGASALGGTGISNTGTSLGGSGLDLATLLKAIQGRSSYV